MFSICAWCNPFQFVALYATIQASRGLNCLLHEIVNKLPPPSREREKCTLNGLVFLVADFLTNQFVSFINTSHIILDDLPRLYYFRSRGRSQRVESIWQWKGTKAAVQGRRPIDFNTQDSFYTICVFIIGFVPLASIFAGKRHQTRGAEKLGGGHNFLITCSA